METCRVVGGDGPRDILSWYLDNAVQNHVKVTTGSTSIALGKTTGGTVTRGDAGTYWCQRIKYHPGLPGRPYAIHQKAQAEVILHVAGRAILLLDSSQWVFSLSFSTIFYGVLFGWQKVRITEVAFGWAFSECKGQPFWNGNG